MTTRNDSKEGEYNPTIRYDPNNDYYELLGLTSKADESLIKLIRKVLMSKCHPDKTKDSTIAQKINGACDTLENRTYRATYDQLRQKYIESNFEEDGKWQEKYEELESAYSSLKKNNEVLKDQLKIKDIFLKKTKEELVHSSKNWLGTALENILKGEAQKKIDDLEAEKNDLEKLLKDSTEKTEKLNREKIDLKKTYKSKIENADALYQNLETLKTSYNELRIKYMLLSSSEGTFMGKYILLHSKPSYALGVHEVKKRAEAEPGIGQPRIEVAGKLIYRPFSFYENVLARVQAYESAESEKERSNLFNTWLDSCTGIAYKKGTTKFKIIPICKELITINKGFMNVFLPIDYDKIEGIELDSNKGKYRTPLTKSEVLNHAAWRACVNEDVNLLRNYRDIVSAEYAKRFENAEKLTGFYINQNLDSDGLKRLFASFLGYSADASGDFDFYLLSNFLLGSPIAKT